MIAASLPLAWATPAAAESAVAVVAPGPAPEDPGVAEPASVGASSERVASALPEAASAVATASTAATEGAAATTGTGSAAATAAESPPPAVAPDTTAPLEEVRSAVPSIRSASAQTGAVVDRAVETVARTVSETAPGDLPVQRTLPPDLHPLQVAGEALRRSPPALLPASAVKSSPSTAAQPATGKASPLPTLWEAPGVLPSSASAPRARASRAPGSRRLGRRPHAALGQAREDRSLAILRAGHRPRSCRGLPVPTAGRSCRNVSRRCRRALWGPRPSRRPRPDAFSRFAGGCRIRIGRLISCSHRRAARVARAGGAGDSPQTREGPGLRAPPSLPADSTPG